MWAVADLGYLPDFMPSAEPASILGLSRQLLLAKSLTSPFSYVLPFASPQLSQHY